MSGGAAPGALAHAAAVEVTLYHYAGPRWWSSARLSVVGRISFRCVGHARKNKATWHLEVAYPDGNFVQPSKRSGETTAIRSALREALEAATGMTVPLFGWDRIAEPARNGQWPVVQGPIA